MTWLDINSTLPELVLIGTALLLLILEVFNKPPRNHFVWVTLAGLALALALVMAGPLEGHYYANMISVSVFTRFIDMITITLVASTVLFTVPYMRRTLEERGEYYALLLFAAIGMMFMAKAHDLTIIFLGLELLSVSLYILVGFYRNRLSSNEASLKYLLLGAFATGFFLFGIALLYGSTGSTNYDTIQQAVLGGHELSRTLTLAGFGLLLIGFAFKVALAPFHMYAPDVYQGAPTVITAFLSTGPKIAAFAALLKLVVFVFAVTTKQWWGVMWVLAVLTMTVGNVTALMQDNIKRMLAYSSVAHAGYLAIGILVGSEDSAFGVLFYLAVYGVTTLTAFGLVALLEREDEEGLEIANYDGLARKNPFIAAMFALALLSLAGFPPTAGFVSKFFIFSAAVEEGYTWLIIIAVLNSLVSVYYYLRPVVAMYMRDATNEEPVELPAITIPAFILLIIVVLGMGIFPFKLVESGMAAAASLF